MRFCELACVRMLLSGAVICLCACHMKAGVKRNVVLVTIDTTRADHIGHLGYERPTTPNLDLLAKQGVAYTRAYSSSSWTAPSHASIFTSLLPSQHGCHMDPWGKEGDVIPLRSDLVTLAEVLREHGFSTAGFTGGPYLSSEFGFAQGFDVYDDQWAGRQRRAREINEKVLAWLDARAHEPFFLFINYFDPHGPYDPDTGLKYPFDASPEDNVMAYESFSPGVYKRGKRRMPSDERTVAAIVARYDQEIYTADHYLGKLIAELRQKGVWDRTLVIVTSDHGESFGDRLFGRQAQWGHGGVPSDVQCHVPLVIRIPGNKMQGMIVNSVVSNMDIFTTTISYLGIARPPGVYGEDLLGYTIQGAAEQGTMAMAERYMMRAYTTAFWKGDFELLKIKRHTGFSQEALHGLRSPTAQWSVFPEDTLPRQLKPRARRTLSDMSAAWEAYRLARGGISADLVRRGALDSEDSRSGELRGKLKALGYLK